MDQDKQTLLEAAKAALFGARFDSGGVYLNLRDAIAREEAKPTTDRAQQAESTAAWHKAESERLSAELALAKNQLTLAVERSKRLSEQLAGCRYDLGESNKQRQRAEKAEAELEERRADGVVAAQDACDLRARAMRAEAKLARVGKQLARLVELQVNPPIAVTQPFEGDPQTCAFGSNAFRGNREVAEPAENNDDPVDPVTGWTFDTYRRVVEALGGKS